MSDGGDIIKFEVLVNNEKFLKAMDETQKRIQGFSTVSVKEVDGVQQAFNLLANEIEATEKVVKLIEESFALLNTEIAKLPSGDAQMQITLQVEELSVAFDDQKTSYAEICERIKTAEEAYISFTERLKELIGQMEHLEKAGAANSDTYKELEKEAENVSGAIENVEKQVELLAKGTDGFKLITTTLGGIQGGFTAAQQALSLFGVESEKLNTTLKKLSTVIEMVNGVQKMSSTFFQQIPGQISVVTQMKQLYTVAVNKLAGAFVISNVAAKALMATLTLGLSVVITGVIAAIDYFISKNQKAAEEAKKMGDMVADACYQPIASVNSLAQQWEKLEDDFSKTKFIEENAEKFRELGVEINSVEDVENLLVNNKDKFIEALKLKAKAVAAAQLATEKYKEAMQQELELENIPRTITYKSRENGVTSETQVTNSKYTEAETKKDNTFAAGDAFFAQHDAYMKQHYEKMKEAEVKEIGNYEEGTIGAIEAMIAGKREALKKAATSEGYEDIIKEIEELEEKLGDITGQKKVPKTPGEDPFLKMLDERKKQYDTFNKWINSGDDIVAGAAGKQFEKLLAEGESYLDYLQTQRDAILAKGTEGGKDKEAFYKLNNAIANETTRTATDAFSKELNEQLASVSSLAEKLEIIAQKKSEINSADALGSNKSKILDEADNNLTQQMKDQTDQLLNDYSSYLDKRIKMDMKYQQERELLEARLNEAPEGEKAGIQSAINNHKATYEEAKKDDGGSEYTAWLQQYKTFEEGKCAILEEFEEKRNKAKRDGNDEMLTLLDEEEKKLLSVLAMDELKGSGEWTKLFSNLDQLTSKEINNLVNAIQKNAENLGIEIDQNALQVVKDKITDLDKELSQKNPFASLIKGIRDFGQETEDSSSKGSLKAIFEDASASLDMVKAGFDSVTSGLQDMGIGGDEVTQQLMGDISSMVGAASELASGIASGNPLAVIQGSVNLLSSAFKVFNINDRKAERQIKKHQANLDELQKAYKKLEKSVDTALGEERYTTQKSAIDNLKAQQEQYAQMAEAERGKKKTDSKKVEEYERLKQENAEQIAEIVNGMREDILGMSVEAAANDLGSAMIEAFAAGEDAAKAWGDKVDDIVAGIIQKMLIQKLVEGPVGEVMNKYMEKWYDKDGNFLGFDEVMKSATEMGEELKSLTGGMMDGLSGLSDILMGNINEEDKEAQKKIQEHQEAVTSLQDAYSDLERAIDKALGEERYSAQKAAIDNLQEQIEHYSRMADEERNKIEADAEKVKEYEKEMKESSLQLEAMIQQMREDILGMDVKSAASTLGGAMIDAFAAGEDAAQAWGNKVDDIVADIIQKMLIQKLVEGPVGDIMNSYMESWYSDDGEFLGFDGVMDSLAAMGSDLKDLTGGLMDSLNDLPDEIKQLLLGISNAEDMEVELQILEHAKAVETLQDAYKELEKAIDQALGEERYSTQKSAIENLQQQMEYYARMTEAERSKIESDAEKVKEYEKQMQESALQIEAIIKQMQEEIMGMNVSSAASELGNAIMNAFAAGEDAAEAWGKKVDDIVSNVIKKLLIQKLVELPVAEIMNKYMQTWVDENGNFLGFDAVIDSAGKMAGDLKDISQEIMAGLDDLPDDIKKYLFGDTDDFDNSLTGAVKGVSEETASLLAGQMNAIRIGQVEANEVMRQQLLHLSTIAYNTSYNYHLAKLGEIVNLLRGDSVTGSLRAQGISYEQI